MQQIDCINQQARKRDLTKRSQAERLAIANSLIASVWEEYLNGSIDRSTLQVAAYIQTDVNRIVWKLNELNNPNSPNISKALDALDCISRQKAIDAFDCTDELIVGGSANAQNVMNYINKVIGKIKALPFAQPEPLSDAYMKAVWTWLLDYQIKASELKGRYTPYEVLSWVANDWRKEHERSD